MQKRPIPVDRFEIPCVTHSEGRECLVCVNGMQQTMASWRRVVRRPAAAGRYQVVLFDPEALDIYDEFFQRSAEVLEDIA